MPQGDMSGPEGKGPRTGRGLGDCRPEFTPETKPKKQNEEFEEDIEYPGTRPRVVRYGLGRGGFPRRNFGRGSFRF